MSGEGESVKEGPIEVRCSYRSVTEVKRLINKLTLSGAVNYSEVRLGNCLREFSVKFVWFHFIHECKQSLLTASRACNTRLVNNPTQ